MQRARLRRLLATTTAASLVTLGAGTALAEDATPEEDATVEAEATAEEDSTADADATVEEGATAEEETNPDDASEATVTVEVNGSLVVVTSDKDISNVRVQLEDGTVEVIEGLRGTSFERDFGQAVLWISAKSGTTVETWGSYDAEAEASTDTEDETEEATEGESESDDESDAAVDQSSEAMLDIDCAMDRTVVVTSDKDISNVYVGLADGSVEVFDGLSGTSFEHELDQDVLWVVAKSGTTISIVGAANVDMDDAPGYLSEAELTTYAENEVCATTDADESDTDESETATESETDDESESEVDSETDTELDSETDEDVDAETDVDADVEVAPEEAPSGVEVLGVTTTQPSAPSPESMTTTAAPASSDELPRTGVPLVGLAALGTAALGAGTVLRRKDR